MDIMAEAMGAALADDLDISDSDDEDGGGGGEGGGNNDQESQTSHSYFICQIDFEIINSILLPHQDIDDKTVVAPAAPPLVPEPPPPDEDGIWF